MKLTWAYASDGNVVTLNQQGSAIAAHTPDTFVILREINTSILESRFREFEAALRKQIYDVLTMMPSELAAWSGSDKYAFPEEICPSSCCVAFKRLSGSSSTKVLPWMWRKAVVQALINNGILAATAPSGQKRTNDVRCIGGVANIVQNLSLAKQRLILKEIFFASGLDLDDITRVLGQSSVFAMTDVASAFTSSRFPTVMNALVNLTETFFVEQT